MTLRATKRSEWPGRRPRRPSYMNHCSPTKDLGEALGKFQALRTTMIEYSKTTHDDMRAHSFGDREVIDCWQWMLEISTHAERHLQQIREIKNDANFPRK
jgi:hypothetical protein